MKKCRFSPHAHFYIKMNKSTLFCIRDMTFECNLPTNLERKKWNFVPPCPRAFLFVWKKVNIFIWKKGGKSWRRVSAINYLYNIIMNVTVYKQYNSIWISILIMQFATLLLSFLYVYVCKVVCMLFSYDFIVPQQNNNLNKNVK